MRAYICFTTDGRTLAQLTNDCGYRSGTRHIFSAGDAVWSISFEYIRVPSPVRLSRSHIHMRRRVSIAPSSGRSARTIERSIELSVAAAVTLQWLRSFGRFELNDVICVKEMWKVDGICSLPGSSRRNLETKFDQCDRLGMFYDIRWLRENWPVNGFLANFFPPPERWKSSSGKVV